MTNLELNPKKSGLFWIFTKQGQEVDYVLETDNGLAGIEIKWHEKRNPQLPQKFVDEYNPNQVVYVNRNNFYELLIQ